MSMKKNGGKTAKGTSMRKLGIVFLALLLLPLFAYAQGADISYSAYMASVGWGGYASNGETAGTTGQKRQVEAIKVRVDSSIQGGVRYDSYVQSIGWTGWQENDAESGTTGQSKRVEAIKVELTGNLAQQFDVRYRVYMASIGWGGWSTNGDEAGTTGQSRQIEAFEIRLVSKAPVSTGDIILDGATNYTVVRGDSLSKIAAARYGNMWYFPLIRLANASVVTNPDLIEVGTTLVIPNLQRNLDNPGAKKALENETRAISDWYALEQGKLAPARALQRQADSLQ